MGFSSQFRNLVTEFVMVTVMGFVLVLFWKLLYSFDGDFVLGYSGSKQFVMVILIFSMMFWWWLFRFVFFSCCSKIVMEFLMVIALIVSFCFCLMLFENCHGVSDGDCFETWHRFCDGDCIWKCVLLRNCHGVRDGEFLLFLCFVLIVCFRLLC